MTCGNENKMLDFVGFAVVSCLLVLKVVNQEETVFIKYKQIK